MSFVVQTGYVIKDDPTSINEEADKILHKVAGLIGLSYVGSSIGFGTRYMAFAFDDDVSIHEAKASLSELNAWVKNLCPGDAPYTFLDGLVSDFEEWEA